MNNTRFLLIAFGTAFVFTFGIAFVAIFQTEFTVVLGGGGAVTVGEYIVSMLAVCALIAFIPAGFLTGIHSFLNIRKQQQKKFHGAEKTKAAEPNIVTN